MGQAKGRWPSGFPSARTCSEIQASLRHQHVSQLALSVIDGRGSSNTMALDLLQSPSVIRCCTIAELIVTR